MLKSKRKKLKKAIEKISKNDGQWIELKLSGEDIGDEGACAISKAIAKNTVLKGLYLCNCQIGSVGAEAIADALLRNSSIEELSLSSNDIGDAGMEALSHALRINTSVTDLHLRSCKVGKMGATSICNTLLTNYTLSEINLEHNDNIPNQIIDSIRRHLKNNNNPSKKARKKQQSSKILNPSSSNPNANIKIVTSSPPSNPSNKEQSNSEDDVSESSVVKKRPHLPPSESFKVIQKIPCTDEETSLSTTKSNGNSLDEEEKNNNNDGIKCTVSLESVICIPKELDVNRSDDLQVDVTKLLGQGCFSRVYAAKYSIDMDDNKLDVACKVMTVKTTDMSEWDIQNIQQELDSIRSFYIHENLVTTLGITVDDDILLPLIDKGNAPTNTDFKIGILFEKATIGSLCSYIENTYKDTSIDSNLAQSILLDVANGMLALHAHRPFPIIHQNLKSSNIMLFHSKNSAHGILAKVADFGLPCILSCDSITPESLSSSQKKSQSGDTTTNEKNKTTTVSLNWRAPETFGKKSEYSEASDVWAYGMIMYELATRKVPYFGCTTSQVMYALCVDKKVPDITDPDFSFTDDSLVDLIENCWHEYPKQRPRFGNIVKQLSIALSENEGSLTSEGVDNVIDRIKIVNGVERAKEGWCRTLATHKEKYKTEWGKLSAAEPALKELLAISQTFEMMFPAIPLQPDYFTFLEDLITGAEICQVQVHECLQTMIEKAGGTYHVIPRRNRFLLEAEINNIHNGDTQKMINIVQSSGIFKAPSDIIHFLENLTTSTNVSIVNFIDHMNNPHPDGYRNVLMYVAIMGRFGPKLLAEVRLHLSNLYDQLEKLKQSESCLVDSQNWTFCTDICFQKNSYE